MSQRSSRKLGEPPSMSKTETPPTRRSKAVSTQQQTAPPKAAQHIYRVGDKVLCLHKGSLYYEAKIQQETTMEDGTRGFLVHYQGWNNRYDESIPLTEIYNRFSVYTNEAAAEAKKAQREAAGSGKKSKGRISTALDSSKLSGTPSGTAASSRSSTPFESNKRRARDSSVIESGGKRSRPQTTKQSETNSPLSTLVPPNQVGLIGQSISSALAQQANIPTRKLPENFLENFPLTFCEILRLDQENIHKGKLPILPARFSIEEIVGDYKEMLSNGDVDSLMHVEYGPNDSLEQTTPAFLSLCANALMDCFNSFIRSDLLYKIEWDSHDKKFKPSASLEEKSKKGGEKGLQADKNLPCKHYGVIHLLRLLSKFNSFLERLKVQRDLRYSSQANVQDFIAFLSKNIKKYYSAEEDFK